MSGSHSTAPFLALADLASARVGGRAIATNDDFFASKANLVKAEAPIFVPGKYTSRGKWMDGWESRRRRTPLGAFPTTMECPTRMAKNTAFTPTC